jgi:arylsulfatase A-like enzyme
VTRLRDLGRIGRAAGAAGIALWLACSSSPPEPSQPPSVVVVLIDQLRKDTAEAHLPQVRKLAESGIVFEQMRAAAPWTYPSVVSLMTGLYPQQHHADGHATRNILATFSPELPLLPQILREHGYRTAAFVANPFLHTWNPFHAGFDSYRVDFVPSRGNLRSGGKRSWSPATMFANTLNPAILAHFDALAFAGPEFTYVHYIDVHGPYKGAPFPPDYAQAAEYLDAKVAELYAYFMRRYDGNLIFAVTSDHGRALGDDETAGQGTAFRREKKSLHDFNLHIPFMILPSRRVTQPRRIETFASNVDWVPTLLDWLGIEPPVALPGVSFLPAIRDGAMPAPDRALYARMSAFGHDSDAIVYRGRKIVRTFAPDPGGSAPHAERSRFAFDLASDPRELSPLAPEPGAIDRILAEAADSHGVEYPARFEAPSSELTEQLRALGYLDAGDRGEKPAAGEAAQPAD